MDIDIDLLEINGITLPEPAEVNLNYIEKYNEFELESGRKTLDEIKTDMIGGSVGYNGLLQADAYRIRRALKLVSSVLIYDPNTNSKRTISAKITEISMGKVFNVKDVGVAWSLDFTLEEI